MKARLTNGNIVELEKWCTCTHHSEPHWLYMNDLEKTILMEELDNILDIAKQPTNYVTVANHLSVAMSENIAKQCTRIQERLRYFEYFHIDELFYDE